MTYCESNLSCGLTVSIKVIELTAGYLAWFPGLPSAPEILWNYDVSAPEESASLRSVTNSSYSIVPLLFWSKAFVNFLKFKPANDSGREIFTSSLISSTVKTWLKFLSAFLKNLRGVMFSLFRHSAKYLTIAAYSSDLESLVAL